MHTCPLPHTREEDGAEYSTMARQGPCTVLGRHFDGGKELTSPSTADWQVLTCHGHRNGFASSPSDWPPSDDSILDDQCLAHPYETERLSTGPEQGSATRTERQLQEETSTTPS